MPDQSVSVLGLGLMGTAVAKAFIKAGWNTTVWNRTTAKAAPLEALGVTVAQTAAECIQASHLTVAVIVNPEALHSVLKELDPSITKGRTILDFTTGSPALTNESIEAATQAGFPEYLHGAILAMPHQVGLPEGIYLTSGKNETFEKITPALKALGTPQHLSTNTEASALLELILVANLYGVASGFVQSVAMLKKTSLFKEEGIQGFIKTLFIPYVIGSAQGFFTDTGRQLDEGDFVTKGEGAKCSQQVHALENVVRTSKELGVSGKLMEPILELFKKRTEQGHGDDEISGLVQLV
ncbi:hypothetical protein MRS44_016044 [Fusarium solani]|uniref:uncharacterized protein n=1 Tax=Fusarium solani TaxID=169388 RepID=UPI0032C463C0|nr:hypothetical protein MRS44_016044 [Fusarium solani]